MALALDAGLRVADIAQIYADVRRDYALSDLCIMSRFRPLTPEDKGGIEAIVSTACVSHQQWGARGRFSLDVGRNFTLVSFGNMRHR